MVDINNLTRLVTPYYVKQSYDLPEFLELLANAAMVEQKRITQENIRRLAQYINSFHPLKRGQLMHEMVERAIFVLLDHYSITICFEESDMVFGKTQKIIRIQITKTEK